MELKQRNKKSGFSLRTLLIVPYGIETGNDFDMYFNTLDLLIVPYGIETLSVLMSY